MQLSAVVCRQLLIIILCVKLHDTRHFLMFIKIKALAWGTRILFPLIEPNFEKNRLLINLESVLFCRHSVGTAVGTCGWNRINGRGSPYETLN